MNSMTSTSAMVLADMLESGSGGFKRSTAPTGRSFHRELLPETGLICLLKTLLVRFGSIATQTVPNFFQMAHAACLVVHDRTMRKGTRNPIAV